MQKEIPLSSKFISAYLSCDYYMRLLNRTEMKCNAQHGTISTARPDQTKTESDTDIFTTCNKNKLEISLKFMAPMLSNLILPFQLVIIMKTKPKIKHARQFHWIWLVIDSIIWFGLLSFKSMYILCIFSEFQLLMEISM